MEKTTFSYLAKTPVLYERTGGEMCTLIEPNHH